MFWDESGASLLPVTRRTWAPKGHTPVIRHRFKWQRTSMAAGLCYGSHGGGAQVAFHHQVGAYDTTTLIGALEGLRRFLGGQKAPLVWDGLPAHRSKLMHAWLGRHGSAALNGQALADRPCCRQCAKVNQQPTGDSSQRR